MKKSIIGLHVYDVSLFVFNHQLLWDNKQLKIKKNIEN